MSLDDRLGRLQAAVGAPGREPDLDGAERGARARVARRRRRRVAVVAAVGLVVAAVGTVGLLRAQDDDRSSIEVVTDPDQQGPTLADRARPVLPVGGADSPFRVAHDLPDGYRIVEATDPEYPMFGDLVSHQTRYHDGVGDDGDAALTVTSFDGDVAAATELGRMTEAELDQAGFETATIAGQPGYRYPLTGEGRTYGTSLLWPARPDVWVLVEAAEPLTEEQALAVATGVEPFPAERWTDLQAGLETGSSGPVDDAEVVEVGGGTTEGTAWSLEALVPPDYGLLPGDRRSPCARLTVGGTAHDELGCTAAASWIEAGGRTWFAGLAPAGTETVEVQLLAELDDGQAPPPEAVIAVVLTSTATPDVAYWVASVEGTPCAQATIVFDRREPPWTSPASRSAGPDPTVDTACR